MTPTPQNGIPMRTKPVLAAFGAVALLVTGTSAYAGGVSHKDAAARTIKVSVADPSGDVVARTGSMHDMTTKSNSLSPFKPGAGTAVTPTADDKAIDLTHVAYKVVRTGRKPALTITYTAAGPFINQTQKSTTATSASMTMSTDMVGTDLVHGYSVSAMDDGKKADSGLSNAKGKAVRCAGFRDSFPVGGHVATITVPLSCLAATHLATSTLQSESGHLLVQVAGSAAGVTETMTVAWDVTAKTRTLPLTPLH